MSNKYIIFYDDDSFKFVIATSVEDAIINFQSWDDDSWLKNDEFAIIVNSKKQTWSLEDLLEFYKRTSDTIIEGVYEVKETHYTTYEK